MKKQSEEKIKLIISVLTTISVAILGIYLGLKAIFYFMPFVVGYIIAAIGRPIVRFLSKKLNITRNSVSALIMILVLALIIVLIYFAIKFAFKEIIEAANKLPHYLKGFEREYDTAAGNVSGVFGSKSNFVTNAIDEFVKNLGQNLNNIAREIGTRTFSHIGNAASKVPEVIISFIVIVMSAYYFMSDSKSIQAKLKKFLPNKILNKIEIVREEIIHGVGGYFKAQFKIMIVIYIILLIGLLIIKAAYAPIVALLIALLDLLPILGTGFVLIPWAIFKILTGNYFMMAGLLILYVLCLVVHQALQPKMIGDSVEMPPMLTLFCIYLGFKLRGILGMIVGVIVGLIIWRLYNDGAFDNLIKNFKKVWK